MRKLLSVLLFGLLLCGLVSMGAKAPVSEAQTQRPPVSVTLVGAGSSTPFAKDAKPLSLTKAKDTGWSNDDGVRLVIYDDGAYLFTGDQIFALTEKDGAFALEARLYRTPFDEEPAMVLPAGTVRILRDGTQVKLEVADDPANILAYADLDGAVLTKEQDVPYRYSSFNFFFGPLEPGTEWFCYFNMGEHRYAILKTAIGEDGAMSGTLTMPDGTARTCALLGNENSFALVDVSGEAPQLLFFGERTRVDSTYTDGERYQLARLILEPICDPLDLTALDRFELWREKTGGDDLRYILGRNLDSLILAFIRDGWTQTTETLSESSPLAEGWFVRLTKDGQTLLIYYGSDAATPYEAWQNYADAYVLYGPDGTVLSWSGSKPIDHSIADGYKLRKGVDFDAGAGARGMIVGEDSYAYFLDDGCIAMVSVEHLGEGDAAFEIIRVIP